MLKLQDTKLGEWSLMVGCRLLADARCVGLAEAALGEGSGVKLHKLSVKELKAVCPFTTLNTVFSLCFPALRYCPPAHAGPGPCRAPTVTQSLVQRRLHTVSSSIVSTIQFASGTNGSYS